LCRCRRSPSPALCRAPRLLSLAPHLRPSPSVARTAPTPLTFRALPQSRAYPRLLHTLPPIPHLL
jgi:hypothetical protein